MANTYQKPSITAELALRLLEAAEKKATEIGQPMATAIVDESGVLKAFSRMDSAPLLAVQVAQDKAHSAAGFGRSTDGWYDDLKADPRMAAAAPFGITRLVLIGGGYPIKIGGQMVGAIGVSGGAYGQDMEVAQAALAILV